MLNTKIYVLGPNKLFNSQEWKLAQIGPPNFVSTILSSGGGGGGAMSIPDALQPFYWGWMGWECVQHLPDTSPG